MAAYFTVCLHRNDVADGNAVSPEVVRAVYVEMVKGVIQHVFGFVLCTGDGHGVDGLIMLPVHSQVMLFQLRKRSEIIIAQILAVPQLIDQNGGLLHFGQEELFQSSGFRVMGCQAFLIVRCFLPFPLIYAEKALMRSYFCLTCYLIRAVVRIQRIQFSALIEQRIRFFLCDRQQTVIGIPMI